MRVPLRAARTLSGKVIRGIVEFRQLRRLSAGTIGSERVATAGGVGPGGRSALLDAGAGAAEVKRL